MAKIAGVSQHVARLKAPITPEGVRLIGATLFEAGQRVQTDAQTSITEGAVSGAGHIPSAPGDAPNADTHVLSNSIETVQVASLKVEVSANAVYSHFLEFGTSRMAARPYMGPALQKNRERIAQRIAQAIRIVNKGGGLGGPAR